MLPARLSGRCGVEAAAPSASQAVHGVLPFHRLDDVEHHQHAMAASHIAFAQRGRLYSQEFNFAASLVHRESVIIGRGPPG